MRYKELKSRKLTSHPDDWYLSVKLVEILEDTKTPYATYICNNSKKEECLVEGHYFTEDSYNEAVRDFENRR